MSSRELMAGVNLAAQVKAAERAPFGSRFVHEQIAAAAKGLAGEFWEQMATGVKYKGRHTRQTIKHANTFYKAWPKQQVFMAAKWPEFVECARGSLVVLLNSPSLSSVLKDQIHDVLLKDGLVNPKRLSEAAKLAKQMPGLARLLSGAPGTPEER